MRETAVSRQTDGTTRRLRTLERILVVDSAEAVREFISRILTAATSAGQSAPVVRRWLC